MRDMVGKKAYEEYKKSHIVIRSTLEKELDESFLLSKIESDYEDDLVAADKELGGSYVNESKYKKDLTD